MVKEACYKSMVRPCNFRILKYSVVPIYKENILMIESIQRRAVRFVTSTYNQTSSVTAMLFRLGWPSLEQRREIAKATMMYKILCNIYKQFHLTSTGTYYYLHKRPLTTISSSCSTRERLSLFIHPIGYKTVE